MNNRPEKEEYPEWYDGYVKSVPDGDIVDVLKSQLAKMNTIADGIHEDTAFFRYEPGKWSIKEVTGHLKDAERILSYRALRYLRGDKTDIPQYDHEQYVASANFDSIPFKKLFQEFKQIRSATISLFENVTGEQWTQAGTSGGKLFTVRAMAYIIAGHLNHHAAVLKEKYFITI